MERFEASVCLGQDQAENIQDQTRKRLKERREEKVVMAWMEMVMGF